MLPNHNRHVSNISGVNLMTASSNNGALNRSGYLPNATALSNSGGEHTFSEKKGSAAYLT